MAFSFFPNRQPAATKTGDDAFVQDLNVKLFCTDCYVPGTQPNVIEEYSSGDLICGDCGKVLGDRIVDTRSEWRTFANEEGDDPSRVGGPSNPLGLDDGNLETTISFKDGHSGISAELRRAAAKASQRSGEKTLHEGFQNISAMCEVISLPRNISDMAKQLFKRVEEERLLRGKAHDAVIAACIFIACRQARVPRTFKEIVSLTKVPKKQIGQCFKVLEQAFETGSTPGGAAGLENGASADMLVPRFCNHLDLKGGVQGASQHVVQQATALGILAGRSPISVVAASIFFVAQLFKQDKGLKEISKVCGVSDVTIRTSYKLLYSRKEDLVLKSWLEQGKTLASLPEF